MNDDFLSHVKFKRNIKLSILICTVPERESMFDRLVQRFKEIIDFYDSVYIEILQATNGKEVSVGSKRQGLLEFAKGDWIVFFDDDDWPEDHYVSSILEAIKLHNDIDCIGIRGYMTTNGEKRKTWCHRLGYEIKGDGSTPTESGYDYMRPIIHFNPVRRELALKAGFKDMRYGEDMDYASRLNPLLTKEYFIDKDLFHYRYSDKTPFKEKYGITE
jgi:hypothetical protein